MRRDHCHLGPESRSHHLGLRQKMTFVIYLPCPKPFHCIPPPAQNTSPQACLTGPTLPMPRLQHPLPASGGQPCPGLPRCKAHAPSQALPPTPSLPPVMLSESLVFSRAGSRAPEGPVPTGHGLTMTFLVTGGGSFPRVLFFNELIF